MSIFLIVPLAQRFPIARSTQRFSGLPFWKDEPEAVERALVRQLPDDRAVLELDGDDVERGVEVDDDAVDLPDLQRLDRLVVVVVDARRTGSA